MKKKREENKDLKLLLAVGGWSERSEHFSAIAADEQRTNVFINSALSFLSQWEFDGIDIDWEFPANAEQGGVPEDKENLPKFLKVSTRNSSGLIFIVESHSQRFYCKFQALNDSLKTEDPTGQTKYLLSIACGTGFNIVENGYDVKEISA